MTPNSTISKPKPVSTKRGGPVGASSAVVSQESYWALWRSADDSLQRAAYGLPPAKPKLPHDRLCSCAFSSPEELKADLLSKGWQKSGFDNTEDRFAKVEATPNGFTVTAFPTYAAALKQFKASISKTPNR